MQIKTVRLAFALITASMFSLLTGCSSQPAAEPAPTPKTAPMAMPTPNPTPTAIPSTTPAADLTVLKFAETSIKAIQAGTKTATIRKGVRTFTTGTARAVGTNGNVVMLNIVSCTSKKMSELSAGDAMANGSESVDALKTQLAKDYPHISDSDVVTVVVFKLNDQPKM